MQPNPNDPPKQSMESVLRNFGIRPSARVTDNLREQLEGEKEKYLTVERVRGKTRDQERDI